MQLETMNSLHQEPALQPLTLLLPDNQTLATIYPVFTPHQLPPSLLEFLCEEFNAEILRGTTFPFMNPLPVEVFRNYWFGSFAGVMVLGDDPKLLDKHSDTSNGTSGDSSLHQWSTRCLGTFIIKPNYPGRSAHICTGTFLVNAGVRSQGIGRILTDTFLHWAPLLGYTQCVLDLVYALNAAMRRLLEVTAFRQVGRLVGGGVLADQTSPTDILIYGKAFESGQSSSHEEREQSQPKNNNKNERANNNENNGSGNNNNNNNNDGYHGEDETGPGVVVVDDNAPTATATPADTTTMSTGTNVVGSPVKITDKSNYIPATVTTTQQGGHTITITVNQANSIRFQKIKYYLLTGTYPEGCSKSEKAKLRTSSHNYNLLDDKLMLRNKEVVIDPKRQVDIVHRMHLATNHGGINRTTATITEKYHWPRVKELVGQFVKNCVKCNDHDSRNSSKDSTNNNHINNNNNRQYQNANYYSVIQQQHMEHAGQLAQLANSVTFANGDYYFDSRGMPHLLEKQRQFRVPVGTNYQHLAYGNKRQRLNDIEFDSDSDDSEYNGSSPQNAQSEESEQEEDDDDDEYLYDYNYQQEAALNELKSDSMRYNDYIQHQGDENDEDENDEDYEGNSEEEAEEVQEEGDVMNDEEDEDGEGYDDLDENYSRQYSSRADYEYDEQDGDESDGDGSQAEEVDEDEEAEIARSLIQAAGRR